MQEVEYIDHMGSDASVVKAARVSFAGDNEEARGEDKDAKLIKYLAKHNHWSPFAHTSITLRVKAPIPIRTQCMKHAVGFNINEESRRYISGTPELFTPSFRTQVKNKKQGSGDTLIGKAQDRAEEIYKYSTLRAISSYEVLLDMGVCEEQARFVLPQGCLVNWYWTGSLSAFARFVKQRSDTHAQLEIQELAAMVSDIIQPLYPVSWKALTKKNKD